MAILYIAGQFLKLSNLQGSSCKKSKPWKRIWSQFLLDLTLSGNQPLVEVCSQYNLHISVFIMELWSWNSHIFKYLIFDLHTILGSNSAKIVSAIISDCFLPQGSFWAGLSMCFKKSYEFLHFLFTRNLIAVGETQNKAAVMQICMDSTHCYVMHIIHTGIPPILKSLLEDISSTKVFSSFDSSSLCLTVKWVMFDLDVLLYAILACID